MVEIMTRSSGLQGEGTGSSVSVTVSLVSPDGSGVICASVRVLFGTVE